METIYCVTLCFFIFYLLVLSVLSTPFGDKIYFNYLNKKYKKQQKRHESSDVFLLKRKIFGYLIDVKKQILKNGTCPEYIYIVAPNFMLNSKNMINISYFIDFYYNSEITNEYIPQNSIVIKYSGSIFIIMPPLQ